MSPARRRRAGAAGASAALIAAQGRNLLPEPAEGGEKALMPPAASATAIVVSHDSAEVLPGCLAALAREGVPAILVDNASRDRSREIAAERGVRVVANARNEGYGRANNLGVALAPTPFVLIVNPDVEIGPGCAAALLAAAMRYPDAALFAPRIVEPSGRVFLQPRSLLSPPHLNLRGAMPLPEGDVCLPFLSGACLLARRDVFLALGGFDPEIFLFYEDDDLCRRIRDAGHALIHVDAAVARHGRGRSSPPSPPRRFKARWHLAWSQRYIAAKYGLALPQRRETALNAAKAAGYGLLFNRHKMFAHAGSVAGAHAFARGETALQHEGLEPRR